MKIISISRGFTTDHSSTSYQFLAVENPLNSQQRKDVSSLSRRCRPDARTVDFIYHVDGYDIPGGWQPLMREYYDVMYSESYDWWTLAVAFPVDDDEKAEIVRYEFFGVDDMGVHVYPGDRRVIVVINCRIHPGIAFDRPRGAVYESIEGETPEVNAETERDYLLHLLVRLRRRLMAGDYRPLYAVWRAYGASAQGEDRLDAPPKPAGDVEQSEVAVELARLLDTF